METNKPHSPIEVALALSLYGYNVSAAERAQAIYDHFDGYCAEVIDLVATLSSSSRGAYAATELALPSAMVYVDQALARYGEEARRRVTFATRTKE